jgi:RimJ/RimL family protein N-acetyltransferase
LAIGLDYCWKHLNLERVGLVAFRNNTRAINAYKAVGFKKEGLLRRLFFIDGAYVDVLVMAAFRPARKRVRRVNADPSLAAVVKAAGKSVELIVA